MEISQISVAFALHNTSQHIEHLINSRLSHNLGMIELRLETIGKERHHALREEKMVA